MNAPPTLTPPPPPTPPRPPTPSEPVAVTTTRTGPLSVSAVLWRVLAGLFVVGMLVQGTFQVITVLAHEERTETETFSAEALTSLTIANSNGRVRIHATAESDEISVRAEISDGLRATGESRTVVGDVLELRGTCPGVGSDFCWVNYDVTVPADLPVTVRANSGRVEVSGLAGDLAVNADDGSIILDGVSGSLDVSTDNGRITGLDVRSTEVVADSDNGSVELTFTSAPDAVRATTNNGSVEVVVPDDGTTYRAELQTDNGRETLEVPTDPASSRTLHLETDNGSVTARTG